MLSKAICLAAAVATANAQTSIGTTSMFYQGSDEGVVACGLFKQNCGCTTGPLEAVEGVQPYTDCTDDTNGLKVNEDLKGCYDELVKNPAALTILQTLLPPLGTGNLASLATEDLFTDAQLDDANVHKKKVLSLDSAICQEGATVLDACVKTPGMGNWHTKYGDVIPLCGTDKYNTIDKGIAKSSTSAPNLCPSDDFSYTRTGAGTCVKNESVFANPVILFWIIIGGALIIIFTQCAIVAVAAALCFPKKKLESLEQAP